MTILSYKGTTAQSGVEIRDGTTITVRPGEVIITEEETNLEDYSSLFDVVDYTTSYRQVKVILTTAQVKALNTTPQTLVSAPGAGYYIDVLNIVAGIDYGSAAYATNTTLEFRYTNGSGTKVTADMTALLTATADTTIRTMGIEAALVGTANAAVVATIATGDAITGDSPVSFLITYRVLPIF